jgi:ATP-dependent protease ClpP protease subunit
VNSEAAHALSSPGPTAEDFLCEKARSVLLVGDIDEWVSRKTIFSLYALGDGNIDLVLATPGGDPFPAQAIADTIEALRADGATVRGLVRGYCMSAGIIPLLACTERVAAQHSMLMIHGPTEIRVGDIRNMEAEQDAMKKLVGSLAKRLAERTRHDEAYWSALLCDHCPHYYTALEALEEGLVDRIE